MSLTPQGFKRKSYEEKLTVLNQYARDLFGNDINLNDDSTIGQFIKLIAYKDSKIDEVIEDVYNSNSPENADGVSLDNVGKVIGITRRPATKSIGVVRFTGTAGTPIPMGTIVSIGDNLTAFVTTESRVIAPNGMVNVGIECTEAGVVGDVPANTIKFMRTAIPGVDDITNTSATSGGSNRETDSQFRNRYEESLSFGGGSSTDSLAAALFDLPGVIDVRVDENVEDVTVNGIPPHSVAPFIYGGSNTTIAQTILKNKSAGIRSHGTTNITIMDSRGNPKIIGFSRPGVVGVMVRIDATFDGNQPPDVNDQITGRVVKYIGGYYDGVDYSGLGLGENVTAFRIVAAIIDIPSLLNATVEFSTNGGNTWQTTDVVIPSNSVAKTNDWDVLIV